MVVRAFRAFVRPSNSSPTEPVPMPAVRLRRRLSSMVASCPSAIWTTSKSTCQPMLDLRIESFAPALRQSPTAVPDLTLYAPDCTSQLIYDDLDGINYCALIDSTIDASVRNLAPGTYFLKTSDYGNNTAISAYQVQVKFNALCGNGIVEGSETCDDGNTTAGDGCAVNCRVEPKPEVEPNDVCGQATGPFAPPVVLGGAITPASDKDLFSFTLPAYADIKVQTFAPGYDVCTGGVDTILQLRAPDCTTVLTTNDNGGVGTCSLINSTTNPAAANLAPGTYYVQVEENGNNATIANYQVLITINALCGDGVIQGTETCDDGNSNSSDGGAANCRLGKGWTCTGAPGVCTFDCGNGVKAGTEQCDDGNMNSGDGCSSLCLVEPGYVCTGTPSMCMLTCGNGAIDGNDICDDGNTTDGDGCSSACVTEANYNCTGAGATSMCTLVEHACNDGMDNDNDGVSDAADTDCQIPAYFPACAAGQSLWVFKSVDIPKAIPDYPGVGPTSLIGAGMTSGNIARAAALYNITHTWDSDLDISLVRPTGTTLDVCSDNGSLDDNFTNTVLDSTCSTSVTVGAGPFAGCYQPETSFSSFAGTSPTGFWKLQISDDASGDVGTLNSWAMIFCTTP